MPERQRGSGLLKPDRFARARRSAWAVNESLSLDSVGNDNTRLIGDAIEITTTFAKSVTGTPRIPFILG